MKSSLEGWRANGRKVNKGTVRYEVWETGGGGKQMEDIFSRTELLFGRDGMERLKNARVAVFGVGGVGGYVVEALARSGIGMLDLIDSDKISPTNINRQILATHSALGRDKVDVARERILDINPKAVVQVYKTFYLPETAGQFDFSGYDYVADAIDTVTGKLELVCQAYRHGTPVISSMGTGNKLDPSAFQIADIYDTSVCPLAKVMRRELKKRGIPKLKVVYSQEMPLHRIVEEVSVCDEEMTADRAGCGVASGDGQDGVRDIEAVRKEHKPPAGRHTPGSNAFVPSVAGLMMAGEIIRELLGDLWQSETQAYDGWIKDREKESEHGTR